LAVIVPGQWLRLHFSIERPMQINISAPSKNALPTAVVQGQAQFQTTEEQRRAPPDLCEVLHPPARIAHVQLK